MKIDPPDFVKRKTLAEHSIVDKSVTAAALKTSTALAAPAATTRSKATATATATATSTATKRRKLWDLPVSSHCLVIGTCLSLAEVKAIAKRCHYDTAGKSDYELHQFFVCQACYAESKIAKGCQKVLEKKFRSAICQVKSATCESDLLNQWQQFSDAGQIAGGLWAIVTHMLGTSEVLEFLYGEIHMLSHLSGASVHRTAAEVPALKHQLGVLQNKLNSQRLTFGQKLKSYRYEVIKLENLNQSLSDQLSEKKSHALEQASLLSRQESDQVRCILRETRQQLRDSKAQLLKANALADERARQLEEQCHDISQLEGLINKLSDDDKSTAQAKCDHSLSGKCVLLLGGMPAQCKHFRAFVESNNGDFLHHDGGVESSYAQIDQLVNRADAVFCPVEQVSHSAMLRAKKICKKSATPIVFLPKSSISAFVSGIRAIQ